MKYYKLLLALILCFFIGMSIPLTISFYNKHFIADKQPPKETVVEPINNDSETEKNYIDIALVGDILLADKVADQVAIHGVNYPWQDVRSVLSNADFSIGNLECAVAKGGIAQEGKSFTFRAEPEVLKGVKWSGIDGLTLANNHILDFGRPALSETLSYLNQHQLQKTGAGFNKEDASKPIIVEKNDLKIGILASSRVIPTTEWLATENRSGLVSCYDPAELIANVRNLKQQVDAVIVIVHWGKEREDYPLPYQQDMAKKLVDAGADVVAGHHPHTLQGIERYGDGLIIYSLGNFVFTTSLTEKCQTSMVATISFDQQGWSKCQLTPTEIYAAKTSVLTGAEKEAVITSINQLSIPFNTNVPDNGILIKNN